MYDRILENEILRLANWFRVITVTGPRQSGKTTLCRKTFSSYDYINLEDEITRMDLEFNRKAYLIQHRKGLIVDEAQNMPELFSAVQVVVDEYPDAHFVLTGSSNFLMMQKITQSLAGRTAVLTLLPFSLQELTAGNRSESVFRLIYKGFYPAVWASSIVPQDLYRQYFTTYIQRDIQQLLNIRHLSEFRRFVILCASRIGTELNVQGMCSELGVSIPTVQSWLNVLEASYILFRLHPFYRNIGKRLVKTPKIYFHDVGLACFLLGITSAEQVETHPLRGALFENMVVCEFLKHQYNHGLDNNIFFYRDKGQHEVDLVQEDGGLHAYEIKLASQMHAVFFKQLHYFNTLFPSDTVSTQVVYTGLEENRVPENGYLNYLHLLQGD